MKDQLKTFLSFFEVNKDIKLICFSSFVFSFGDGLFTFLLPVYINQLNASPTEVGMLYAVNNLSWGVTLMLGGLLADRFDQKKIMILGSLLWVPVPLELATATNWNQLWLPMILYGTYFGSSSTCVYVLRSAPSERTMQAFGLWSSSVALGYVFSPLLGGAISSAIGKQTAFLMAAAFYGISIVPLIFISKLHKEEPKEKQKINPKPSSGDFTVSKRLIILCIFFTAICFAIFLVNPLVPQYTHYVYHQSIFNLGAFGTATSVGWFFFAVVLGKIGDKRSKMTAVIASTVVTSLSILLIAMINNFPFLCAASFMFGASSTLGGFMPAIVGSAAPESSVGRWISVCQTSVTLAGFGAPIIGGVLYEISPYWAFFVTILVLSFLTIVGLFKKL